MSLQKSNLHGHKISNSNVLRFFHSYINYGIIAWAGFYKDKIIDSSAKYTNKNLKNHT